MQTKTLVAILASAITVSAYPIPFIQPNVYQETISTQYTAADGFADCQGKGLGDFVCWANEDARSYGKMGALELSKTLFHGCEMDMANATCAERAMETPLRLLIKGPAFCCKDDPFVSAHVPWNG